MNKPFFFQMAVKSAETKASNGGRKSVIIKGFASTPDIDRYRDIVEPTAFKSALELFMKNPVLLRSHDSDQAAGNVLSATVTEKGLWIEAEVLDEKMQEEVMDGRRRALSIGYIPLETAIQVQPDDETLRPFNWAQDSIFASNVVRVIKQLDLVEISLVTTPANGHALFTVEKSVKECLNSLSVKSFMKTKKQAANVPAMIKHVVTEEDLKANPELDEHGVKVGETIEFPAASRKAAPQAEKKDAEGEDTEEKAEDAAEGADDANEDTEEKSEEAENQETGSENDEGGESDEDADAEESEAEADADEAEGEDSEEAEGEEKDADESEDEGDAEESSAEKAVKVALASICKAEGVKMPKETEEALKGVTALDLPKNVVPLVKTLLGELMAKTAEADDLREKLAKTPSKKALAVTGQFKDEEEKEADEEDTQRKKDGKPSKAFGLALRSLLR